MSTSYDQGIRLARGEQLEIWPPEQVRSIVAMIKKSISDTQNSISKLNKEAKWLEEQLLKNRAHCAHVNLLPLGKQERVQLFLTCADCGDRIEK